MLTNTTTVQTMIVKREDMIVLHMLIMEVTYVNMVKGQVIVQTL